MGLVLAAVADTLRGLDALGVPADALPGRMAVRMGVTQDLFVGVAQLRALRAGLARLLFASGVPADAARVYVHAASHEGEAASIEPWTNVLRATGAAMAAALGGADAITVAARDARAGGSAAGRRLALTTHAVLRHEAHLAAVADAAGGSRHVEDLTDRMGRAAWSVLQAIVAEGGLGAACREGRIGARLAASRDEGATRVARRRDMRVGVSAFARPTADRLDAVLPDPPGIVRRDAPFERLRARVAAAPVTVALVTLGPVEAHKARASFAAGWYAAAGIDTVEVAADAPWPDVRGVCVCGADADYAEGVPAVLARAAAVPYRAVAGRPGASEAAWRDAGLTDAIHLGADLVAGLSAALDAMGVP